MRSPPSSALSSAAVPATAPLRTPAGTFPAGVSGNPAGKPKGLKNHITQRRLELEAALTDYLAEPTQRRRAQLAIDRLFDVVEAGDDREAVAAIKILFGSVLTSSKQAEEKDDGRRMVTVIIDSRIPERAGAPVQPAAVTIEDAEYINIETANQ